MEEGTHKFDSDLRIVRCLSYYKYRCSVWNASTVFSVLSETELLGIKDHQFNTNGMILN